MSEFNKKILAIFLIIYFSSLYLSGISKASIVSQVKFNDRNFESIVRKKLNKPTGPISSTDMLKITTLSAEGKEITNLRGIEYAVNLKVLELKNNKITSIAFLANLSKLEKLDVEKNNISDFTVLKKLVNLKILYAGGNKTNDISALGRSDNLKILSMEESSIQNIDSFCRFKNLAELYLSNNEIADIKAISGVTDLKILAINNNLVKDVSSLIYVPKLEKLYISDNCISEISSLNKNIKYLDINNNYIDDEPGTKNYLKLDLLKNNGTIIKNEHQDTNLAPAVLSTVPCDRSENTGVKSQISISLNKQVCKGKDYKGIIIKDAAGNSISAAVDFDSSQRYGRALIIKPNGALCKNMKYKIIIPREALMDKMGNCLGSDYSFEFTTVSPDPNNLEIVSTCPCDGAAGIPLNISNIAVNFNYKLANIGPIITYIKDSAGNTIKSGSMIAGDSAIKLIIMQGLKAGTSYTVYIEKNPRLPRPANDIFKNNLSFCFTTVSDEEFGILKSDILDGEGNLPVNKEISITFNKEIKLIDNINCVKMTGENGIVIPVSLKTEGDTLLIKSKDILNCGTRYNINIAAEGIEDINSQNMISDYSISFITASSSQLTALSLNGEEFPKNVPVASELTVTFNKSIKIEGSPDSKIELKEVGASRPRSVVLISSSGSTLKIKPIGDKLKYNTTYCLSISKSTVCDMEGNGLDRDYSFCFTTESKP